MAWVYRSPLGVAPAEPCLVRAAAALLPVRLIVCRLHRQRRLSRVSAPPSRRAWIWSTRVARSVSPDRTPIRLAWRTGDKVLWKGYAGTFLRETVDDHAEVLIGTRTYRLRKAEL